MLHIYESCLLHTLCTDMSHVSYCIRWVLWVLRSCLLHRYESGLLHRYESRLLHTLCTDMCHVSYCCSWVLWVLHSTCVVLNVLRCGVLPLTSGMEEEEKQEEEEEEVEAGEFRNRGMQLGVGCERSACCRGCRGGRCGCNSVDAS
jgi:hypothetical protein